MNNLPNFILSVDEDNNNITETSFVENPATGLPFQLFSEDTQQEFRVYEEYNKYQRIVSGVWMMPDTKYYRNNNGYEYTVEFTQDSLKTALLKYLKSGNYDKVKLEHKGKQLEGFTTIEHWVYNGKDTKSPVLGLSIEDLGLEDLPIGTVLKSTYVDDVDFWNEYIMTGKVKGFSIGGLFNLSLTPRKNIFSELGLIQESGSLNTDKGLLHINLDKTESEDGLYSVSNGLQVIVKDGVVVDYGFNLESVTIDSNESEGSETNETSENEETVESNVEITEEHDTTNTEHDDIIEEATHEEPTTKVTYTSEDVELLVESKINALLEQFNPIKEQLDNLKEENALLKQQLVSSPIKQTVPKVTAPQPNVPTRTVMVGGIPIQVKV